MENSQTQPKPLNIERREKLKIFAITSVHKDIVEVVKEKSSLALIAAYTLPEALVGVTKSFEMIAKEPSDYVTPYQIIEKDVDTFVQTGVTGMEVPEETLRRLLKTPQPGIVYPLQNSASEPINKVVEEKEKSIMQMISYVKYVFDKVGTEEEKEIANKVTEKFKKHGGKAK